MANPKLVRIVVDSSLTIGNERYNSGLRAVKLDHAVALRMLKGDSKADAIKFCEANLTTEEKISKEREEMNAKSGQTEPESQGEQEEETPETISELTIDDLKAKIKGIEDTEELEAILKAEKANQDRKGAKEALEARIEDLTSDEEEETEDEEEEKSETKSEEKTSGEEA